MARTLTTSQVMAVMLGSMGATVACTRAYEYLLSKIRHYQRQYIAKSSATQLLISADRSIFGGFDLLLLFSPCSRSQTGLEPPRYLSILIEQTSFPDFCDCD